LQIFFAHLEVGRREKTLVKRACGSAAVFVAWSKFMHGELFFWGGRKINAAALNGFSIENLLGVVGECIYFGQPLKLEIA